MKIKLHEFLKNSNFNKTVSWVTKNDKVESNEMPNMYLVATERSLSTNPQAVYHTIIWKDEQAYRIDHNSYRLYISNVSKLYGLGSNRIVEKILLLIDDYTTDITYEEDVKKGKVVVTDILQSFIFTTPSLTAKTLIGELIDFVKSHQSDFTVNLTDYTDTDAFNAEIEAIKARYNK